MRFFLHEVEGTIIGCSVFIYHDQISGSSQSHALVNWDYSPLALGLHFISLFLTS